MKAFVFLCSACLFLQSATAAQVPQVGQNPFADVQAGNIRTLSHACRSDMMQMCSSKNVHSREAIACLDENIDQLTPVCRQWHEGRKFCWKDLQNQPDCEECAKLCPAHSNALHCFRKLGGDRVRTLQISSQCRSSQFFQSLVKFALKPENFGPVGKVVTRPPGAGDADKEHEGKDLYSRFQDHLHRVALGNKKKDNGDGLDEAQRQQKEEDAELEKHPPHMRQYIKARMEHEKNGGKGSYNMEDHEEAMKEQQQAMLMKRKNKFLLD
jgi:hypothetical protein